MSTWPIVYESALYQHGLLFTNRPYTNMAYCLRIGRIPTWPIVYQSAVYQHGLLFTNRPYTNYSPIKCWSHKVTMNLRSKLSRFGRVNAIDRPNKSTADS